MPSTYSVTKAQALLPQLLKNAATKGSIAITRRDVTVAYLISCERMEAIAETMDLLGEAKAMKAIQDYEAGRTKFLPLSALDK